MGAAGSGGPYTPPPPPLPAALIGLEQRIAATGSRDRPNLRMQQYGEYSQDIFCVTALRRGPANIQTPQPV
ncbi:hypothetical protein UY3_15431 [Chelonia mydas]|uniref:Uncharacterized protein n=1 Tax=Chelonia mydas TaxID=8469 RepID=M7AQA2_CHEMY|nr:hypothetical protein UY3_15431 [Chelonia mydas]